VVTIINYGMGNIGSIANMLRKIGVKAQISSDKEEISRSSKIIIPGVGSFDNGMIRLKELDLIDVLNQKVLKEKTPVLGICLGMHLLTKNSEEGVLAGLGWVDAETVKFSFKNIEEGGLRIPHMGWNTVNVKNNSSKLFKHSYKDMRFYFVHSYYVKCKFSDDILTETNYGGPFTSSVERENIFGVQFHPEKSHKYGMMLMKNFAEL